MRKNIWQACFVIALIMFARPQALAVDVERLEDLTGGAVPVVTFEQHDIFTNEYLYTVKVINRTGDPILGGTLVLVISSVQDQSLKDVLGSLEVFTPDGRTGGKPYFVLPTGGLSELPPYQESQPITVRLRSPDYVRYFPPSFQVRGIRRTATQSLEKLIQQLKNKGILSEAEAQKVLRP
jgi:hypothetical protein